MQSPIFSRPAVFPVVSLVAEHEDYRLLECYASIETEKTSQNPREMGCKLVGSEIVIINYSDDILTINSPLQKMHLIDTESSAIVKTYSAGSEYAYVNSSNKEKYKNQKSISDKLIDITALFDRWPSTSLIRKEDVTIFVYLGKVGADDRLSELPYANSDDKLAYPANVHIAAKLSESKLVVDVVKTSRRYKMVSGTVASARELIEQDATHLTNAGIDVLDSNISFENYWKQSYGRMFPQKHSVTHSVSLPPSIKFAPDYSKRFNHLSDNVPSCTFGNTEGCVNMTLDKKADRLYFVLIVKKVARDECSNLDKCSRKTSELLQNLLEFSQREKTSSETCVQMVSALCKIDSNEILKDLMTTAPVDSDELAPFVEAQRKKFVCKFVSDMKKDLASRVTTFVSSVEKRARDEAMDTGVEDGKKTVDHDLSPPKLARNYGARLADSTNGEMKPPPPVPMRHQSVAI